VSRGAGTPGATRRVVAFAGSAVAIESRGARAAAVVEFALGACPAGDGIEPVATLRLDERPGGRLRLEQDGVRVYEDDDAGTVASVLLDVSTAQLRRASRGGLLLHAAAVAWRGRPVLVPAPSAAGKTTLAAWLVAAGAGYMSDDLAYVREGTHAVEGFARPLHVRPASREALAAAWPGWPGTAQVVHGPRAQLVRVPAGRAARGPSPLIAFACYDPAGDGCPRALSAAQATVGLLGNVVNAGNLDAHGFQHALGLARASVALAIRYRACPEVLDALERWRDARPAAPEPKEG
jgi:hypothetical protein